MIVLQPNWQSTTSAEICWLRLKINCDNCEGLECICVFKKYVDYILTEDEKDSRPVCPFPCNNGECYVVRRDPEEGCLSCEWAKKSFESLKK